MTEKKPEDVLRRSKPIVVGLIAAGLWSGHAAAFQFETSDPDLEIRWDNTVRYNLGVRVDERDRTIGDTWTMQAGEHKFDKGDLVTNRVDLLTEFDFVIKKNFGFRLSGAAWYDAAYDEDVEGNPAFQAAGLGTTYPGNKFTSKVKRYYLQGGELLDAFVFGRADLGSMPLDVRVGRHNIYWGESLFSPIHGVSYSQGPVNFSKSLATPGSEAKELFLPLNQVSAVLRISDTVSVAGQYQLEWERFRLPEGGTYLSSSDLVFSGGTRTVTGVPFRGDLNSGRHAKPEDRGNWGLNAKLATDAGNIGFYYRNFDDRVPQILLSNGALHNAYAENVGLAGVSFSTSVGGVAVGAELVHRDDTVLNTAAGSPELARGDTWHALANAVAFIGRTPLFDAASVLGELTYSRLDNVKGDRERFFRHIDHACPTGSKFDGCSTDDAWGIAFSVIPTWYQAFPSVDVTMPISYNRGLSGNSPVPFGGNEGSGSWSVGVGFDYKAKYKLDIAYTDYYGRYKKGPNPFAAVPGIGDSQLATSNGNGGIHDRGWLSVTFKTTF